MTTPMSRSEVLDAYFIENRAKVLDLAAFLDRFGRASETSEKAGDPRMKAILAALAILQDAKPERARRVLELWSDPTAEPIAKAPGKGAIGAWPGVTP